MLLCSAFECDEAGGRAQPTPGEVPELGKLDLGVQLADESEVQIVRYEVVRNEEPVRAGQVPVGLDGTASVTVEGLEATPGYRVELAATRKQVIGFCRAHATFAVVAGKTTEVPMQFECDEAHDAPAP